MTRSLIAFLAVVLALPLALAATPPVKPAVKKTTQLTSLEETKITITQVNAKGQVVPNQWKTKAELGWETEPKLRSFLRVWVLIPDEFPVDKFSDPAIHLESNFEKSPLLKDPFPEQLGQRAWFEYQLQPQSFTITYSKTFETSLIVSLQVLRPLLKIHESCSAYQFNLSRTIDLKPKAAIKTDTKTDIKADAKAEAPTSFPFLFVTAYCKAVANDPKKLKLSLFTSSDVASEFEWSVAESKAKTPEKAKAADAANKKPTTPAGAAKAKDAKDPKEAKDQAEQPAPPNERTIAVPAGSKRITIVKVAVFKKEAKKSRQIFALEFIPKQAGLSLSGGLGFTYLKYTEASRIVSAPFPVGVTALMATVKASATYTLIPDRLSFKAGTFMNLVSVATLTKTPTDLTMPLFWGANLTGNYTFAQNFLGGNWTAATGAYFWGMFHTNSLYGLQMVLGPVLTLTYQRPSRLYIYTKLATMAPWVDFSIANSEKAFGVGYPVSFLGPKFPSWITLDG